MDKELATMQRCTRCLLPVSTPELDIGADGFCSVCQKYQSVEVKGESALRADIRYSGEQSSEYDCLVPISGGLDSVYTAFYLSRQMGLRCLGVHYDHGLGTVNKVQMLTWIENKLGMKIVYRRWQSNKSQMLIRDSILALLPFGPQTLQAALCRHCGYGIRAAVYGEMVKYNLHSIWGKHTLDNIPFRYCNKVKPLRYLLQRNCLHALRALRGRFRQTREIPSPGVSPLRLIFSPMGYPNLPNSHRHLKNLAFFSYIRWDKQRMLDEIRDSGLDTQALTSPHSDCQLAPIVDRLLQSAWTVGKKEIYVCNMVRASLVTKEAGLEQITKMREATLDITPLLQIGLSQREIDKMLKPSA
jgi:hypothetical protein